MKCFRCDICGKEIGRWYRINVIPYAMYDEMNVSHMVNNEFTKDVCEECIEKVKRKWGELINEQPTEHSQSESHRANQ